VGALKVIWTQQNTQDTEEVMGSTEADELPEPFEDDGVDEDTEPSEEAALPPDFMEEEGFSSTEQQQQCHVAGSSPGSSWWVGLVLGVAI